MTDRTWVAVAPATDVASPPWPRHDVAGHELRLVRAPDDTILAIAAACPHLASPLDRAEVEDGCIWCPRHWYAYDAATGENRHPGFDREEALAVHPVEVRDGIVHVWVEAAP